MIHFLLQKFFRNSLDAILDKALELGKKKFLVVWNRGLGGIPHSVYAFVQRIQNTIPDAQITFLTRLDLREGFALLENVETLVSPQIRRGQEFSIAEVLSELGHQLSDFDHVFEKPTPFRWLKRQVDALAPKLHWQSSWDSLCERFALQGEGPIIGVQLNAETEDDEKNWPVERWREFFSRAVSEYGAKIVLFGFQSTSQFEGEGVIDLRGRTSLIEMISIIKNCCSHIVVPDTGVLSIAYYLDVQHPLRIVSLWANPARGVLGLQAPSPNLFLKHYPLIGKGKDTARIPVEAVMECLMNENLPCYAKSF